jgi:hypothetical protein
MIESFLNVAFNYGGRAEILDGIRRVIEDGTDPDDLTEEMFSQYLYHDLPDPDLIIRTGGEWRLSNFLIWQAAYAEYYTTPTYWPDFDQTELYKALAGVQPSPTTLWPRPRRIIAYLPVATPSQREHTPTNSVVHGLEKSKIPSIALRTCHRRCFARVKVPDRPGSE